MAVMAGKRKRTPVGAAFGRVGKATVAALAAAAMLIPAAAAQADPLDGWKPARPNSELGLPTFKGINLDRTFDTGVGYDPSTGYLAKVFEKDKAAFEQNIADGKDETGYDYWIDRMLARTGTAPTRDPNGQSFEGPYGTETSVTTGQDGKGNTYSYNGYDSNGYLFTRGRAAYMYTYDPAVIGFGGNLAYWDVTGKEGYDVAFSADGSTLSLTEDGDSRKQTPSYWKSDYATKDGSLHVGVVKYITDNNVLVTELRLTSDRDRTVTMDATSPLATMPEGDELTGRFAAYNNVTTVYPRFSGNGFTPKDGKLTASMDLKAGQTQVTKLQLGLTTTEIPQSRTDYDAMRDGDLKDPVASYSAHVTAYNKWWADNIPYIETGDESHNIDKTVFYRWWLNRFNYLDANMPGNVLQYPTSIEGVLGYNNAIDLTIGMFMEDYKWMRNPEWSYGPWLSAGETQGSSGQYRDNPAAPDNWGASHMQWISEAAWDSYKIHGGPADVAGKLADYASSDTKGQLAIYDSDGDDLLDTNWNAWTGNDADAVSFDEVSGARLDRAESATVWSGAVAAAEAYRLAGEEDKAKEMDEYASRIKTSYLKNLWDGSDKIVRHQFADGAKKGQQARYKEINNLMGYGTGMMPAKGDKDYDDDYEAGLRLLADADEHPIFPFATANQADDKLVRQLGKKPTNNFSVINSEQYFRAYGRALRQYHGEENGYVTPEMFKQLLYWNAFAHYQGGDNRYPDQNEFWNNASTDDGGRIQYRSWIHHTQLGTTNWTMIEDVAGMVPREDNKIELNPIALPDWNHFTVNNLSYHGQDLSIVWNNDGHYANAPKGYTLYLGGKAVLTSDKLAHLVYDPSTGSVEVKDDSGAKVTGVTTADLKTANQVTYGSDSRVTDIFAKSGQNVDSSSKSQIDVARDADVKATYATDGYPATNAVDGKNVMESFWGTKGSPNAKDTITVTFKGGAKTIDDVRVYFYQTSSSQTINGYKEPAVYTLEYQDADGSWKALPNQVRTPAFAGANYNRVQFDPVTTKAIRATFTPQGGQAVGLKEIEAFDTGIKPTAAATNQAPTVDAYVDSSTSSGAQLVGVVKDDGLPNGELDVRWTQVSGPEGGVVRFADDTAASTVATFNVEGDYVLRLTATDGEKTVTKDLTVHGVPSDGTVNIASQATAKASSRNSYAIGDVAILNDGVIDPEGSDPMKSWNNWGNDNDTNPTVTYTWKGKVPLSKVQAYFWSDGGGVPMPKGWKVQWLDGDEWKDVTLKDGQKYTITKGKADSVSFEQVWTTSLRIVFSSTPVGLSELEAYAADPLAVDDVHRMVQSGTKASDLKLPTTVSATYGDGSRHDLTVTWPSVSDEDLAADGEHTLNGSVAGALGGAKAVLNVKSDATSQTSGTAQPVEQSVYQGAESIDLPATVPVQFPNGAQDDRTVTWDEDSVKAVKLDTIGDYEVTGKAEGSSGPARLTVHVIANPTGPQPGPGPEPEPEPLEGWIENRAESVDTSAAASWSPADGKLNDGVLVDDSWPSADDQDVNAKVWGTWGQASDGMYAQYTWGQKATVDSSRVQFWANFAGGPNDEMGGLEIPTAWKIQYRDGDEWKDVTPTGDGYTIVRNDPAQRGEGEGGGWSIVSFEPVTTDALRLVLTPYVSESHPKSAFGTAVAEWGVHAEKSEEPGPEPTPEVNKDALKQAIERVEATHYEEARFTPKSWEAFTKAIADAKAVLADENATQEQVDAAALAVDDSPKLLVERANMADLNAAIADAASLSAAFYTADSWEPFAKALAEARKVAADANASQQQVDAARKALLAARKGLKAVVNKDALSAAIDRAEGYDASKYSAETWQVLVKALADAKAVLGNKDATQKQVDAALAALDAAMKGLSAPAEGGQTGADVRPEGPALSATGSAVAGLAALALLAPAVAAAVLTARRRRA